jgi:dTDP-4-amino-4,6-dideoxygalactose transaminase
MPTKKKSAPKKTAVKKAAAPVPMIDLVAQVKPLKKAILKDWAEALDKAAYIHGPHGKAFEAELAAYIGVKHVVGCNSGTDALLLALRALGVGPGDEVLVPGFSFFATAEVVSLCGATPVFCDVEAESFLLDFAEVEAKLSPKTKAVMPVHLFGQCVDVPALRRLLDKRGRKDVRIVEDNAQALGARLDGRRAGALGDAAGISFYPTKNLSAAGDAGALATDDDALAAAARRLREHGMPVRYTHSEIGYNSRLDELQAIALRHKLPLLDKWNKLRAAAAARYAKLLKGLPLGLPQQDGGAVWHQYTVRVPGGHRDKLAEALRNAGIGCAVFYPTGMHQQKPYERDRPKLPVTEQAGREVLSLPMHPFLSAEQQARVAAVIREHLVA